jgi:hypothetical protein
LQSVWWLPCQLCWWQKQWKIKYCRHIIFNSKECV